MLSNTPRLNFCYLKVIHILHQYYHPKVIGHILKNKQTNRVCLHVCQTNEAKCVCIHHIIRLIIMKMKNRSHRNDINRLKPGILHIKRVSRCCCLYALSSRLAIFEALFMKNLRYIDTESNKSIAYIKKRVYVCPCLEISFFHVLFYLY